MPIEARLLYDNGGGVRDSGQIVIRDAETLRRVWTQATSTQSTPPAAPEVDFQRQMLLLVSSGRMSPDAEIHVDSVGARRERTADGREQEVLAVQFTITEGCRRFNRDAYPVEIVRIRRYDGEVRFHGRRERASGCQ
ncbi:MAG TPA: hypothetical protein VK928_09645 [Longimicrobiales bacterium]|nr:hypothetical protein [Longimicrobiales bacterium]